MGDRHAGNGEPERPAWDLHHPELAPQQVPAKSPAGAHGLREGGVVAMELFVVSSASQSLKAPLIAGCRALETWTA